MGSRESCSFSLNVQNATQDQLTHLTALSALRLFHPPTFELVFKFNLSIISLQPALNVTYYKHIWQMFSMEKQIDQTVSCTLKSQTENSRPKV